MRPTCGGSSSTRRQPKYAQNQWKALTRFLDDGELSLSNSAAENALRPFAVGRKNWLFFSASEAAGRPRS